MEWRQLSAAALDDLTSYYWPGNIRQLKNVIEHLYIMSRGEGDEIMPSELPREIVAVEPVGETYDEQVDAFQRSLLITALKDESNNQKAAAERLGLTYDRFRHIFKKLGLKELLG
ncbi:MAG: AAA-type ATPase lid domain-containing protein [Planctomycetota bacterium]|jgi:DNA-binding NtrC family response regulator